MQLPHAFYFNAFELLGKLSSFSCWVVEIKAPWETVFLYTVDVSGTVIVPENALP